jgi:hypothetical protein
MVPTLRQRVSRSSSDQNDFIATHIYITRQTCFSKIQLWKTAKSETLDETELAFASISF